MWMVEPWRILVALLRFQVIGSCALQATTLATEGDGRQQQRAISSQLIFHLFFFLDMSWRLKMLNLFSFSYFLSCAFWWFNGYGSSLVLEVSGRKERKLTQVLWLFVWEMNFVWLMKGLVFDFVLMEFWCFICWMREMRAFEIWKLIITL